MTSPCSSSSPGSPYSPQPSTSNVQTTSQPVDDEKPCCSRSLSASSPSTSSAASTANNTNRAAKRKFKETTSDAGEEGERPRKCLRKTQNIEPLSPPTSPLPKHKRSSRACLKNPLNEPPWKMALRCRDPRYKGLKKQLNARYLQQLQQECAQAISGLDDPQRLLAQAWNDLAQNASEIRPAPIVLFKRLLRDPSRLSWEKLARAISMLTTTASSGPGQRLGLPTAARVTQWLKYFFQNLEGSFRTRHLICGSNFTRLCGQALAAQQVDLAQQNETRLSPEENRSCFLSVDDLAKATSDPNILHSEHSVVFLRHPDEPRRGTTQQESNSHPIQEFEENNNSQ